MKIAIIGSKGRMGQAVCEALNKKFELIEIDKTVSIETARDAEIVVDFSSGKNSVKTAVWCEKNNKKLIIGATGQTKSELKKIVKTSGNNIVVLAGNFSIGIARIKKILKTILTADVQSVSIIEKHHKDKKDSPSGTALELKAVIESLTNKSVQVYSVRGGKEIGTHEIDVYYENEVIRISHQAFSRDAFVRGVELSVDFVKNQSEPGLYEFRI